jgi:predicted NUDIX family NTP pyrophosphohydrolase
MRVVATVRSAGILLHRRSADGGLEVLLAHMGGPFWARKDAGAWSVPKGEYTGEEEPLAAARREFSEELGRPVPDGTVTELGELRQPSGKRVSVWAVEADFDPATAQFGTFTMEWPPRSGRTGTFPEVDRVEWFALPAARDKLVRGQVPFLDRLVAALTPTDLRPS